MVDFAKSLCYISCVCKKPLTERMIVLSDTKVKAPKSFKEKLQINKNKVLYSVLVSFALFVLLVAPAFSQFFKNAWQFNFLFKDFALPYLLTAFGISAVLFLILFFSWGIVYNCLFALYSSVAVIGCIQNLISALNPVGLHGEGQGGAPTVFSQIANFIMWLALASLIVWLTVLSKKKDFGKLIITFALIFTMVTQIGTTVIEGISYSSDPENRQNPLINALLEAQEDSTAEKPAHLTKENMFQVSTKKNIIVIILDRFDLSYWNAFVNSGSPYLEELDGFTSYTDNIAKYPRTFPAVVSMLTGKTYDNITSRYNFLEDAYSNSTFLKDLKANGYKINLYLPDTDGYTDARVFDGMVSNTAETDGYTVESTMGLVGKMFSLGSYFWTPEIIKANNYISTTDINDEISVKNKYTITDYSDAEIYDDFSKSGLKTQSSEGTFTFLHLRGCHSPFTIDENCEPMDAPINEYQYMLPQVTGMFKFISEYLQELKDKGLYEDATIIITGDHATLYSDTEPYDSPKLTGLLVKESGESGTPLKTSSAQVSQDNLLATIVKSAGITPSVDYGKSYSEVKEGETVVRTHYFDTLHKNPNEHYTYTITGPGNDFRNWEIEQN